MKAKVVVTGPCQLSDGRSLVREALRKAADAADLTLTKSYDRACAFVVASRVDTVKATKAVMDKKLVLTYDQFVGHLLVLGVDPFDPKFADGVTEDPIVDKMPEAKTVTPWTETDSTGAFVL